MSSARLSGRVESRNLKHPLKGHVPYGNANDSLANSRASDRPPRRLTSASMQAVIASLSERDFLIIRDVVNLRLVSSSQLQRLHFVDGTEGSNPRRARLALSKLTDLRVLARLDRRIGGVRAGSAGHIYCLDVVGQFIARVQAEDGRRRRPFEPGLPFVSHTLAIAELYVRLVEAARAERVELVEFSGEPKSWRTYFGTGGARMILKPDAFVRTARGAFEELWFVEVDRATEGTHAILTKLRTYRQYWSTGKEQQRWENVFPRVLWLVPNMPRVRRLLDAINKQPENSRSLFAVRLFDEAMETFAPGEQQ